MASYVIHHVTGVKFLEMLEQRCSITLTQDEKNKFLLGNLIVDSVKTEQTIPEGLSEKEAKKLRYELTMKIQEEKRNTHFRDLNDQELVVQVPKLENFILKYNDLIVDDITALGYFFHLYTDKMFFENLFNDTFECLDIHGDVTIYMKNVDKVRIKKNNEIHNIKDFFDIKYPSSIYNDYTTINKILLEYYSVDFNSKQLLDASCDFINPGIDEVDYEKIVRIIGKTSSFIERSYEWNNTCLNVFDEEKIKEFINVVFSNFMDEYGNLLLDKSNEKRLSKKFGGA